MTLRLYNTLSRAVEEFRPLAPPRVTLYTCGPTVWNYAHIGNFRTFVFEDVLRRYLDYRGFEVVHVMNLTDVDDRTINAANAAGVALTAHTAPYTRAFFEDRDYLRLRPAHHYPAATGFIPQMVALVSRLLEKRVAYRGDDGSVYFGIERFATYGRLSRIDTREIKVGARVSSDEYAKEDARDFVLWKAAKPEDEAVGAAWDAPFGRGRPGWHLECSAMAQHYLGDTLDLHAGGVDLIFPHHEDEIAQSEAATGKPFARVWLHGEFLMIRGTKMSKRYGNFLTARDLREQGVEPAAVRYLFGQTHYRKQLDWSDEALEGAATAVSRLGEFRERLAKAPAGVAGEWGEPVTALERRFLEAMDEDLNVPGALAALMDFVREGNGLLDRGLPVAPPAVVSLDRVAGVLQVVPAAGGAGDLDREVRALAEERQRHRRERDWARADEIRNILLDKGFDVRDTKDGGYELRRVGTPRW
ncbi:MAG: cysteine--tRNA ligase [Gemmatimonadetes bacterium RIFCSPLOWO2_02_FULL_71_11]|nr:MAG: cysteine--tRNA ligase [Gemmatimonadetes bacterium RIFCSPLOWO2_02_FULL_71_11]